LIDDKWDIELISGINRDRYIRTPLESVKDMDRALEMAGIDWKPWHSQNKKSMTISPKRQDSNHSTSTDASTQDSNICSPPEGGGQDGCVIQRTTKEEKKSIKNITQGGTSKTVITHTIKEEV
jgi:hypothetical protein